MGQRRKKLKKALSVISNIIFLPLIVIMIALCCFLLAARINNSLPSVFGNLVVTVVSGSMEPEFQKGDVVIVKKTAAEELEVGDVIAFYRYSESEAPSVIWFHRIVAIGKDADGYILFQTKGDANASPDANWTREDYVVGVYNEKAGFLHEILTFAVSTTGITVLIIVPCGLIFIYEAWMLIRVLTGGDGEEKESMLGTTLLILPETLSLPVSDSGAEAGTPDKGDESADEEEEGGTDGPGGETPGEERAESGTIKSFKVGDGPKVTDLNEILARIDGMKGQKRVAPKRVMKEAIKLEKLKNSAEYKADAQKRKLILEALNWCYETIGKTKYENAQKRG